MVNKKYSVCHAESIQIVPQAKKKLKVIEVASPALKLTYPFTHTGASSQSRCKMITASQDQKLGNMTLTLHQTMMQRNMIVARHCF